MVVPACTHVVTYQYCDVQQWWSVAACLDSTRRLRHIAPLASLMVCPAADARPSWHDAVPVALQMALKSADLGHLTSSLEVHKKWVARLEEVRDGGGGERAEAGWE